MITTYAPPFVYPFVSGHSVIINDVYFRIESVVRDMSVGTTTDGPLIYSSVIETIKVYVSEY